MSRPRSSKEGMLKSYKFESKPPFVQEIDIGTGKVPFEIASPKQNTLSIKQSYHYEINVKKPTRGTRSMLYEWTGDVVADGQGVRILGTGRSGTFTIPPGMIKNFPAVLNVRVAAINANGKAYAVDQVYTVTE